MTIFSTRIIKGGALLEDTRRLLEVLAPGPDGRENTVHSLSPGVLGRSSARQADVLSPLRHRFLEVGSEVLRALRALAMDPRAFREACYYEAARTDGLLAAFASGPLYTWYWQEGRSEVTVEDVVGWLRQDPRAPDWGEYTRRRVAQGLLSTLRDFGILEGTRGGRRKHIPPPHLSLRGFTYAALRERARAASDRALLQAPSWRWYLLDSGLVRRLFLQADREGVLRFSEAGTVLRIDWLVHHLEEVARVPTA
jgi:hypothetical protein